MEDERERQLELERENERQMEIEQEMEQERQLEMDRELGFRSDSFSRESRFAGRLGNRNRESWEDTRDDSRSMGRHRDDRFADDPFSYQREYEERHGGDSFSRRRDSFDDDRDRDRDRDRFGVESRGRHSFGGFDRDNFDRGRDSQRQDSYGSRDRFDRKESRFDMGPRDSYDRDRRDSYGRGTEEPSRYDSFDRSEPTVDKPAVVDYGHGGSSTGMSKTLECWSLSLLLRTFQFIFFLNLKGKMLCC